MRLWDFECYGDFSPIALCATMRKFGHANQTSILSAIRLVGGLLSSAGRIER